MTTQEQEITLANLPEKTEQQVFEYIAKHLLEQNAKATRSDTVTCMYKTSKGLRCAAGCLIDEDTYNSRGFYIWEGTSWYSLVRDKLVPETHAELISALQRIHDKHPVENWKTLLADEGKYRELDVTFLSDFTIT